MFVLVLTVSRVVPLLFMWSAVLVAGRLLHDRYRPARPLAARGVFAGVLVLGLVGTTPWVLRSGALVAAEFWVSLGRWERADAAFELHQRLGGRPSRPLAHDWAVSRLNLGRWRGAEEVLLGTVSEAEEGGWLATPNTVYLLGVCRYYQGRWQAAERSLRAVEDSPVFFLRGYYLGRLAERRGEPEAAMELYRRCLELKPNLLAPRYQLVRLLLERGERQQARELVESYPSLGARREPLLDLLEKAVARPGVKLPPTEFRLVQVR